MCTRRFLGDGFPLPNEWNIVHSLALNEEVQMICGADRENFRIQCFNSNTGKFLRQIRVEKDQNIGAIYAIEFAPNTNGLSTIENKAKSRMIFFRYNLICCNRWSTNIDEKGLYD